ncbi:MAG TPA: DUF885 domain-containing protein [Thermoplasmata archaeon]|nr:DUF885 domain-containing protein [Thermoplasmata archaeon]
MAAPTSKTSPFDALERAVIDHLFVLQPGYAVGLGLHEYDGRLPDFSVAATDRWTRGADELLSRLSEVPEESLPSSRKSDRFLLTLLLESPLFDIRSVSDLERNPMNYLGSVSLTQYLIRDYAPAAQRVEAIARTLEQVPRLLQDGRDRLRGPLPKPFVDLSLAIGSGLPAHLDEAQEFADRAHLSEEVRAVRVPAVAAITEFLHWLREYQLPKAVPEFALGPTLYQQLLFVREGIEAPFEEIRRAGTADLARNQRRLDEIARASQRTVPELLDEMNQTHPTAEELIPTARSFVEETRRFVSDHGLVTVPEEARCRVDETPVWGRALSTASMNPPGPFDSTSSEGVYYVTPVDAKWTATQQDEWLRSLNRSILRNTTVHEVYPGHYLQFLHFRRTPGSLARKVYLSPSFVEGWAHYAEQLAVENGVGHDDRLAEVAQLHDALLRNTRLLVSIGLHTGGMTLEEATRLFQTEAHMERLPAEREAIRGTFNPEYFCYTLGKLAILNARHRLLATKFGGSLRSFHDTLLALGCPPVGLLDSLLESAPAA